MFYQLIERDIQMVAEDELGRELTFKELISVKEDIAERIDWYEAIAEVINKRF